MELLKEVIQRFKEAGIRTSIFMDTDLENLAKAKETGTDRVELYTESYAVNHEKQGKEAVKPYLSKEGLAAIEKEGLYIKDFEGDYSTTTINSKECAFAIYDDKNVLKCGIEQANLDGKTTFKKPLSCHLYPIRITKYDHYEALNYDRWEICSAACTLGQKLGVPVYKFLKDALIRKYGEAWYQKLCEEIEVE